VIKTRLTELFGLELPIIQGGLAYLALADLCAAVCNAGGLGQITAATLRTAGALREEIRKTRSLTHRPFAVNFAIGHRPLEELIDITLEEGVRIVSITGGNPEPLFRYIDARVGGVEKIVLVAGTRAAQKAEALGASCVIAVGFDGGGHLGRDDIGTMALVPRVVDAVRIPVVAGGGIADGRGLAAALALGAEGIEMGTRFVAVKECAAHPDYKGALVAGKETDTTIVERSLGRPSRVLRGPQPARIQAAEAAGAGVESLLPMIAGDVNRRGALEGDLEAGYVYAGQGIGLIRDVVGVAELFAQMEAQARQQLAALRRQFEG